MDNVTPPRLPDPPRDVDAGYVAALLNTLRLFFARLTQAVSQFATALGDTQAGVNTLDTTAVKLAGTQTVTGEKTFTVTPRTPNRPAFHAQYNGASAVTAGQDIPFNVEVFDVAGNYNPANGRFTAPITGTYFFSYHGLLAFADTGDLRTALCKNGSVLYGLRFIHSKTAAMWFSFTGFGTVQLVAGDYVTVRLEAAPSALYTDVNYNGFSGHLLG
jgi:hypothetical protein